MRYGNGWLTRNIEYYNSKVKEYKVSYLDDKSDCSPDVFDGVEVILERL